MSASGAKGLLEGFAAGDERALARAISLVENGRPDGQTLLGAIRKQTGRARFIGITGSPGSGKSTLVDRLISVAREQQRRVAVIAVDPASPYTGGAILGDRIRMTRHHHDRDVFIRSMSTRGHLGGLAAATLQVAALLDAYGFEDILIETVGVGQSEVEIVEAADTTVLVLTPGSGDGVQAFKSGIMEIADIFVINKFDQPGGTRLKREIKAALELAHPEEGEWWPPIVETVATTGQGADVLYTNIGEHREHLRENDLLPQVRDRRARFEVAAIIKEQLSKSLEAQSSAFVEAVLKGDITPQQAVKRMLGSKDSNR